MVSGDVVGPGGSRIDREIEIGLARAPIPHHNFIPSSSSLTIYSTISFLFPATLGLSLISLFLLFVISALLPPAIEESWLGFWLSQLLSLV
ncbi:hypothetical protein VNO80_19261 [Phaseolus coccineus]|uniref:Uncharacterized protein n=1 Tax=Phaseolus coccineus TaxID=3886 RepID=A0AAN9R0G6_PHACN